MTSSMHTGILKNVKPNETTGLALAAVIMAEANRREHLAGSVVSATWSAEDGIVILVKDAGHRQHLANAIALPSQIISCKYGRLSGEKREGRFLGYQVTVWNLDY